jgi:peptidoglycan/xylan/chitin deacetylase (PgdA/CDA1 family)
MTTLTNIELVAQFGWTMELIHNSTGGRLPRFWRPPYGDSDVRVHAIAKEVFGLTAILWNQECVRASALLSIENLSHDRLALKIGVSRLEHH